MGKDAPVSLLAISTVLGPRYTTVAAEGERKRKINHTGHSKLKVKQQLDRNGRNIMKQQILIIVAHLGKWEGSTPAEEQLQWQSCCYKKWAWLEQVPSQKRQASCQERCASSRYELCTEILRLN